MKKLHKQLNKIFSIINDYPVLLNKFSLLDPITADTEKIQNLYVDVFNYLERFKKKELKLEKILYNYKYEHN
jgi:hemerythrin